MICKKDSKKSAPIKRHWYAREFYRDGKLESRSYQDLDGFVHLNGQFGFQKSHKGVGVCEHITTMACEPPKFASMEVEHGCMYYDYPDPQPKLYRYFATEEEAQKYVDHENATRYLPHEESKIYYVVRVDANGMPLKSEIKRLTPILLADKEELDKKFGKKRSARYRAQKRRDDARGVNRATKKAKSPEREKVAA